MLHPAAFDDLPYLRIAFYATRSVRLWQWPAELRARVLVAAMTAESPREAALAAIDAAWGIIQEANQERQGDPYQRDDARPVNRNAGPRG